MVPGSDCLTGSGSDHSLLFSVAVLQQFLVFVVVLLLYLLASALVSLGISTGILASAIVSLGYDPHLSAQCGAHLTCVALVIATVGGGCRSVD